MKTDSKAQKNPVIVWFRDALRIKDNPAFYYAARSGFPVLAIYIFETQGVRVKGEASRYGLDRSLEVFSQNLKQTYHLDLVLLQGDSRDILPELYHSIQARAVYWTRRYSKAGRACDEQIKHKVGSVQTFDSRIKKEANRNSNVVSILLNS